MEKKGSREKSPNETRMLISQTQETNLMRTSDAYQNHATTVEAPILTVSLPEAPFTKTEENETTMPVPSHQYQWPRLCHSPLTLWTKEVQMSIQYLSGATAAIAVTQDQQQQ